METETPTDLRWHALVNDFRRSGLTHAEFCRERGISLHTFRRRLYGQKALAPAIDRGRDEAPLAPARFLPVTLVAEPAAVADPGPDPIVLILDGRRRIAVAPGFDAETLRRLVDAVEARA